MLFPQVGKLVCYYVFILSEAIKTLHKPSEFMYFGKHWQGTWMNNIELIILSSLIAQTVEIVEF